MGDCGIAPKNNEDTLLPIPPSHPLLVLKTLQCILPLPPTFCGCSSATVQVVVASIQP